MVKIRGSIITPLVVLLSVNIPILATLIIVDKFNFMGLSAKLLIDIMILVSSDKTIKKMGISFQKGAYIERE